jgi:tetratricopeptide (TPR) repeat protein
MALSTEPAEPLHREVLSGARQSKATEAMIAGPLANLGMNLLFQQKFDEAAPILRECLAIREAMMPDQWLTFNSRSQLGGSLLGQKKYAEAEPLLLAGYEGMRERAATIPPPGRIRLPEALERVVQLYNDWGKPDEAAQWRAKDPISLAQLAASRKQHQAAAELYRDAFASQPELGANPLKSNRYNAACTAALAAVGQGTDAADLTDDARVVWRKQAPRMAACRSRRLERAACRAAR